MKALKIFTIVCTLLISSLSFAEEASTPIVKPIAEVKNEAIDFDQLPKESVTGALAEHVTEKESVFDSLEGRIKKRKPMLYPYSEGLAYVNGFLSHIGNYPYSIIYTVLEGPQYGLQTVTDYNGFLLYVNYDYSLEYTPHGMIFHHYYDDSETITGSTQVISFY